MADNMDEKSDTRLIIRAISKATKDILMNSLRSGVPDADVVKMVHKLNTIGMLLKAGTISIDDVAGEIERLKIKIFTKAIKHPSLLGSKREWVKTKKKQMKPTALEKAKMKVFEPLAELSGEVESIINKSIIKSQKGGDDSDSDGDAAPRDTEGNGIPLIALAGMFRQFRGHL